MEEGHVDGALVDNVAESGEDSEDEWNYYKGEGEREEKNASEEPEEQPRSETPCQDNVSLLVFFFILALFIIVAYNL